MYSDERRLKSQFEGCPVYADHIVTGGNGCFSPTGSQFQMHIQLPIHHINIGLNRIRAPYIELPRARPGTYLEFVISTEQCRLIFFLCYHCIHIYFERQSYQSFVFPEKEKGERHTSVSIPKPPLCSSKADY